MNRLYERMQNALETSFIQFLNDVEHDLIHKFHYQSIKIHCFLGGSQRFGYATKKSDTDFFVYVNNSFMDHHNSLSSIDDFKGYMFFNDFVIDSDNSEHYPNADLLFKHKYQNIHVVVILSESTWEVLRDRHRGIAEYLENNNQVTEFITRLKNSIPEIKGGTIYRILSALSS